MSADFPRLVISADVLLSVIACVAVSLWIGLVLGRGWALCKLSDRLRRERQQIVAALQTLLHSTDQLTSDVGSRTSELAVMESSVKEAATAGELATVQEALLHQISEVVQTHRRLEDDLVMTRYRLEEQAQELDRTRKEARTDELSGLANRKSFDERLQYVMSRFNRNGTPFALLLADVDHFKRINDTHGHRSGDAVVSRLGLALRQLTTDADHVARFGGDEFALILVGASPAAARATAARIQAALEQANFHVGDEGARLAVALSMGMAFPHRGDSADTIFQRADRALYRAKQAGRNQLQVAEAGPAESRLAGGVQAEADEHNT